MVFVVRPHWGHSQYHFFFVLFVLTLKSSKGMLQKISSIYSQTWGKKSHPLLAQNPLSHGLCGMVTGEMEQWNLNVFQPPVGNS